MFLCNTSTQYITVYLHHDHLSEKKITINKFVLQPQRGIIQIF